MSSSARPSRIALIVAFAIALLTLSVLSLGAQAKPDSVPAITTTATSVLAVLDTTPQTVASLVARTQLPEAVVRAAVSNLWARRDVRYRLVVRADGDTTASGRPRRERAYYVASPPASSAP